MNAAVAEMSAESKKVLEDLSRVKGSVKPEQMNDNSPQVLSTVSHGDVIRQGDVYLVCIPQLPEGTLANSNQLAPGDTQGSRHCMVGPCKIYDPKDRQEVADLINGLVKGAHVVAELVGPVIDAKAGSALEHPEHRHFHQKEDCNWAVVYQRDHAEEVRRRAD